MLIPDLPHKPIPLVAFPISDDHTHWYYLQYKCRICHSLHIGPLLLFPHAWITEELVSLLASWPHVVRVIIVLRSKPSLYVPAQTLRRVPASFGVIARVSLGPRRPIPICPLPHLHTLVFQLTLLTYSDLPTFLRTSWVCLPCRAFALPIPYVWNISPGCLW